jgi:hypothetical protein
VFVRFITRFAFIRKKTTNSFNSEKAKRDCAYYIKFIFRIFISETINNPKVNAIINASKTVIGHPSFRKSGQTPPAACKWIIMAVQAVSKQLLPNNAKNY